MDHEINMVSDISGVGVGAVQKISGSWLSSGSDWARANLARPKMTRANLAR
jgi:L-aminopeptidase/D-esterase-like protein